MLIEITRQCNEQCSHCMVNACPTGMHMSDTIFVRSVEFALDCGAQAIHISGGDPFYHPKFFRLMRFLLDSVKNKPVIIGLQSNGWWIEDESLCNKIKRLLDNPKVWQLQIATHKKYYPNYEWTMSHESDFKNLHEKVEFSHDWQGTDTRLSYMGRAKNFMTEDDIQGFHQCMNYIQYALILGMDKKYRSNPMKSLLEFGFQRLHTCIPYIDVFGNIKLGEGDDCKPVINIKDYKKTETLTSIFNKIKSFTPCNKCRCSKNYLDFEKEKLNNLRLNNGLSPLF